MIRGIGPTNPNMKGAKLVEAFESCGFSNVRSFLTSGNVLFESKITDTDELEKLAEAALPRVLDFERDVLIRSQADLQKIVDAKPFSDLQHQNAGKTYLTVTFFKELPKFDYDFPYQPDGKAFQLLGVFGDALCCVVDLSHGSTTDLMPWLERQFGKHITTRTYNTVTRLLQKMR